MMGALFWLFGGIGRVDSGDVEEGGREGVVFAVFVAMQGRPRYGVADARGRCLRSP